MIEMSVGQLDRWSTSLDALTANVERKYRELRKDGVVGMGRNNLRMIVSTAGVHVAPSAFGRLFDQALERANVPAGFFYGEGGCQ